MKVAYGFYNKEVVNKAKQAQETALKNFREKHGLDENGQPLKKEEPPKKKKEVNDPEEPAWFKTYREAKEAEYAELKTKLEAQEKSKTQEVLSGKLKSRLKEKGVDEDWLLGRNLAVESEDKIDQLVATVETDYNTFKQKWAEKGVVISPPLTGGGIIKEGAEIGKRIAEKHNKEAAGDTGGKKV
jgi:hypothetical protein